MKRDIPQWKDEILNSIQGMERAQPDDDLFSKIEAALPTPMSISKHQIYWAAAAAVILMFINFYAIDVQFNTSSQYSTTLTSNTSLYSDYKLYE